MAVDTDALRRPPVAPAQVDGVNLTEQSGLTGRLL